MIYLDTHVLIWLFTDRGQGLSTVARQLIEKNHSIFISPMVMLELDFLKEIHRITLGSQPVFEYLNDKIGLSLCEKPFSSVVHKAAEQSWTRDPFDRIITSQAALDQNILVTKDETIRKNYHHAIW